MANEAARQRFDELRAGGATLPSPSGVALAILQALQRPEVEMADIAALVQTDPAIAGRVLRYANAAPNARLRPVASVKQAVTFLGLSSVRQITLAFGLVDRYRQGRCNAFDYPGFWSSSLAAGIAAHELAHLANSPPDESFTCGLLAGIGRLAMATAFPEDYAAVLRAKLTGSALLAEETAQFGIHHAELSAELLAAWGLPEIFADAVCHHEDPGAAPFTAGSRVFALSSTLRFAVNVGHLLALDEAQRWELVPSLFNAAAQAGIERDDVAPLVEKVVARWQEWAREFRLPTRAYPDLKALLASPPIVPALPLPTPALLPLRVVLHSGDATRRTTIGSAVETHGQALVIAEDWASIAPLAQAHQPCVAMVELRSGSAGEIAAIQALHRECGPAVFVIALLPAAAEGNAPTLLGHGIGDYLLFDASPATVLARLVNAQRFLVLQSTLKTERELVVSASGEWAKTNRRLLHEALTDPLTQLPNRRYGMDRFNEEWSIATSNSMPIGCLMIDIDHFKQVNDKRGHATGDVVLRQVATAIEGNSRRSDIAFRYGGEEFCVICPNTSLRELGQLAERIRKAIGALPCGAAEAPFAVTISVGAAVRHAESSGPEQVIAAADNALYAAKQGGRNRVVIAR